MSQAVISVGAYVLGSQVSVSLSRSNDGAGQWSPSVAAGKAGSLTTRTDNDTGVATLSTGHGIVTSDKVDVFWDGGRRYGMTATVATNAVTIDGGAGDNLPAQATAVVLCKRVEVNAAFDPDDMLALLVTANKRASVVFVDSVDAVLFALDLAAGECCLWWSDSGITRPFTGNAVAKILVGNGDSAAALALTVAVLYDATP